MPVSNFKQARPRPATKAKDQNIGLVSILDNNGDTISEEDHRQRLYENVQSNQDGTATCKVCGKTFGGAKRNANMSARRHVEIHMEGLSYSCSQCGKTFRSKNSLT